MKAKKDRDYDPDEDLHPDAEHKLAVRAAKLSRKKGFSIEEVCRMHGVTPEDLAEKK